MRRYLGLVCVAATLTVFGVSAPAQADRYDDDYDNDVDNVRIYGGLGLGFGGDLELDDSPGEADLGTSIGGQFGVDFLLARYFALGAETRISGFEYEGSNARSRFIDIVAKPRLRFPLNRRTEVYGTVPIGLTIPRIEDRPGADALGEKLGWNVGIGGGLTWFLGNSFGLNVEPIYLIHKFDSDSGNATAKQFAVLLNAVLAL